MDTQKEPSIHYNDNDKIRLIDRLSNALPTLIIKDGEDRLDTKHLLDYGSRHRLSQWIDLIELKTAVLRMQQTEWVGMLLSIINEMEMIVYTETDPCFFLFEHFTLKISDFLKQQGLQWTIKKENDRLCVYVDHL